MAINLWKAAGMPTSYNPLPASSMDNRVDVFPSVFVLSFKAKSATSDDLSITGVGAFNLTPDWKDYKFELDLSKQSSPYVRFYDGDSSTTIEIENIVLVEKPLGKLTVNGVDGFLTNKGKFSPNLTIIDDETARLDAVSRGESSYLFMDVIPNTDYYVSADSDCEYGIFNYDASKVIREYSLQSGSFNSGDNTTIRFYFKNVYADSGTFYFRKPMINLGRIKAPYEKKKGTRMVKVKTGKNLLDFGSAIKRGNTEIVDITKDYIHVKTTANSAGIVFPLPELIPDRYYTLSAITEIVKSAEDIISFRIWNKTKSSYVKLDMIVYENKTPILKSNSLKLSGFSPSDELELWLSHNMVNGVDSEPLEFKVYKDKLQLEEGDKATTYEPFKLEVYTPAIHSYSKNMLPPFTSGEWALTGTNLAVLGPYEIENKTPLNNYEGSRYALTDFKRGQTYTISFDDCTEDTKIWIHYIDKGYTTRQDSSSVRGAKSYTFTTPTDISYDTIRIIFDNATSRNRMWVKNPIMAEGSIPTKFEPQKMKTKPIVRSVKAVRQLEAKR